MKTTPNFGLKKPEQEDFYNVDDFNHNADVIDQELANTKSTVENAQNTANNHASRHAAGGEDEITPEMIGAASQNNFATHLAKVATQTEYGHIRLTDIPTPEGIPRGIIVMWSGSEENIPSGWALCNGENGTPDLRDRFIVSAGNEYNVGDTGGEKKVELSIAQMPSHNHGSGSLSTGSAGSHKHTGSTDTGGSHSHSYTDFGFDILNPKLDSGSYYGMSTASKTTGSSGSHSHSLSMNYAGSHSHSISGDTDYAGSGDAHENRPPYYALCFIMKL